MTAFCDNLANRGERLVDEGIVQRVLVCDDEDRLAELTASLLRHNGFYAESVPDAKSALARLTAPDQHFDVLLLDLNLRGTTAADVVRDVDSRGLDVRVILTSGYASEDVPEELMRQPRVAGYLPKPYPVDGLVASVRRALSD